MFSVSKDWGLVNPLFLCFKIIILCLIKNKQKTIKHIYYKKMEKELKEKIEWLLSLKRMTKYEVKEMEIILRQYVDKRMTICSHCGAQIVVAQRQLSNWYARQLPQEEVIVIEDIIKGQTIKNKVGRPRKNGI